jgi:nucleoid DNA-binding protein
MNKLQLAMAITADIGVNKTTTYAALIALTQELEAQGFAGRAVVWDNFGTFWPRRVVGQRTGRIMGGGVVTYDNYKLIDNPEIVSETEFIQGAAGRADLDLMKMALIMKSFKAIVLRSLRRGRSVYSWSHGGFKVGRRKARVYRHEDGSISSTRPARLVILHYGGKNGPHQKFVGLAGLV